MIDFNEQLFKKHQKKLLFCANRWYLRWLLGLNRLPKQLKNKKIVKIGTNSIYWKDENKMKAACFTRPRFAEALAFNLSPFCYFKSYQTNKFQWRFSPAGLAFGLLFGYFGGMGFMGTTTSYYAVSGDGYVYTAVGGSQPSQATWDTCHDGASGTAATGQGTLNAIIRLRGTVDQTYIYRGFVPISTAALPNDATISSATLKLWGITIIDGLNGDGYDYIAVVKTFQANDNALEAGDFEDCGYDSGNEGGGRAKYLAVKGSGDIDISGLSTGAYNDLALNATGLGWINKTGMTMLGIREGHDIEDNFPGDPGETDKNSYCNFDNSAQTGTDQDPYLEVTYTTGITLKSGSLALMGVGK